MDLLQALAKALPRLRTQFQLTGLVVLVGGYVAVRAAAPEQVHAQISAGAVGIVFLVFGQVFSSLGSIPAPDRAKLIVRLFLAFLAFVVLLVGATGYFLLHPKQASAAADQTDNVSPSNRALLVADLLQAYLSVGRTVSFFEDWGRPPTLATMRIDQGEVYFRAPDGRVVSRSVDPRLLPVPNNYSPVVVEASGLTSLESADLATFFSAYGQFRESLIRLTSVTGNAVRGAFIDATAIAREATNLGNKALCSLGAVPPPMFPPGGLEPIPPGCQ